MATTPRKTSRKSPTPMKTTRKKTSAADLPESGEHTKAIRLHARAVSDLAAAIREHSASLSMARAAPSAPKPKVTHQDVIDLLMKVYRPADRAKWKESDPIPPADSGQIAANLKFIARWFEGKVDPGFKLGIADLDIPDKTYRGYAAAIGKLLADNGGNYVPQP